jgi:hypothetical protein
MFNPIKTIMNKTSIKMILKIIAAIATAIASALGAGAVVSCM